MRTRILFFVVCLTIGACAGKEEKQMYTDSLAFVELEAAPPIADRNLNLRLAHLTSSHPWPGGTREKPSANLAEVLRWHRGYVQTLSQQPRVRIVRTKTDLRQLGDIPTGVILGLQNPPQDIIAAEWMASEGIVFTTVAYNTKGVYGSGYYDQEGGLTEKGKEFLRACAKHGRILDLSHASAKTARDVRDLVEAERLPLKVVVTHAGISDLYDNPRNLPADVLEWVAKRGGYVAIPMFMFFLDGDFNEMQNESLDPLVRHLRFALERFGEDAVGVGTDTPYVTKTLAEHKAHFKRIAGELDPEGKALLAGRRIPELQHHPRYYSPLKMQLVEAELSKHFPEAVVKKLVGQNFWNWCLQNLPD